MLNHGLSQRTLYYSHLPNKRFLKTFIAITQKALDRICFMIIAVAFFLQPIAEGNCVHIFVFWFLVFWSL